MTHTLLCNHPVKLDENTFTSLFRKSKTYKTHSHPRLTETFVESLHLRNDATGGGQGGRRASAAAVRWLLLLRTEKLPRDNFARWCADITDPACSLLVLLASAHGQRQPPFDPNRPKSCCCPRRVCGIVATPPGLAFKCKRVCLVRERAVLVAERR